jgi:biotin carboxyl carrier protein
MVPAFCYFNDLFLFNIIAQSVILIIFLAGYWEFFGLKSRYIFTSLTEAALLINLYYRIKSISLTEINLILIIVLSLVEIYLLYQLVKIFLVRYRKESISFEIKFPLRNGKFLITDGGNSKVSRLMNYHYYSAQHKKKNTNKSMLFATDIVKIEDSYPSFFPTENSEYPVFGEPVFSPISGTVVKIENTIQDNRPYCGNYPYNSGNTVVIQQNDNYCLLGHLKFDSIKVQVGDEVSADQMLAMAGNSGMSERPHIHMQLIKSISANYWSGEGISMVFHGINLYKNKTILN